MKYYFTNNKTGLSSTNLMDVVENPLFIKINTILNGSPLSNGTTPYENVFYKKEENQDFYDKLSGNTLTEIIQERTCSLKNKYGDDTAVLLSGGVDSSIITMLWEPKEVWTLDNGTEQGLGEVHFAKVVANKIGAKMNLVTPQKDLPHLKKIIAKNGLLSRHSGFFALDCLMRKIKEAGYKNILIGSHADYCFGHFKIGFALETHKLIHDSPMFSGYNTMCEKAIGSPDKILLRLLGMSDTIKTEFNTTGGPITNRLHDIMGNCDDQEQYNECFLEEYYGLTLIDPFKSEAVETFAFSYDKQLDYTHGKPKTVLLNAFDHLLPDEILHRTHKVGCSVPYWRWFPEIKRGDYKELIKLFMTWHLAWWKNNHSNYTKIKRRVNDKLISTKSARTNTKAIN